MSTPTTYKSNLYYDVVIKYGSYKGWKADYVGMGRMTFRHTGEKGIINIKYEGDNWMKKCWNYFISKVDGEGE